jgi:hypothetical protein
VEGKGKTGEQESVGQNMEATGAEVDDDEEEEEEEEEGWTEGRRRSGAGVGREGIAVVKAPEH